VNKLFVGRELRMIELKEAIKKFEQEVASLTQQSRRRCVIKRPGCTGKLAKVKVMLFIAALAVGVFSSGVWAEQRTYVMGVEDVDLYPLYMLKDNEWIGLSRDILDAFAEKYGYTFEYQSYPVARLRDPRNWVRPLDLIFPDNPLWWAEQKKNVPFTYSQTIIEVIEGTIVLPEKRGKGLGQIRRLGTITGFVAGSYEPYIKSGQVVLEYAPTSINNLKKVLAKRIDGAYLPVDNALYLLRTELKGRGTLVFDPTLPHDKIAYLLSTTKHPRLIKEFNRFLQDERVLIERLIRKYRIYVIP
jgi:polar amino acid transport system substrate-binding protein